MSLTLPKKITLVQSTARERQIVAKLRANVEAFERKIADPIHVSDLLEPRKGYWQRIMPKRFKDEAIMFFSMGYMGHDYLLGKFDSGSRTEGDLIWSPDGPTDSMLVPVDGSLVVEVKITTKRTVASTQSELEKYLKQVLAYMAKGKKTKAEIWIWYLGILPILGLWSLRWMSRRRISRSTVNRWIRGSKSYGWHSPIRIIPCYPSVVVSSVIEASVLIMMTVSPKAATNQRKKRR